MRSLKILRESRTLLIRGASTLGLLLALVPLAPSPAAADGTKWMAYAGRWGVGKDGTASEIGFELQRPFRDTGFDIVGGFAGTEDEAFWAYAGTAWNWQPQERWLVRPGFAISVFDNGDGKDLGGPIEFRSSLEATLRVRRNLRLGLLVYHLSNAGFYDLNPGSNSVVFVVAFP